MECEEEEGRGGEWDGRTCMEIWHSGDGLVLALLDAEGSTGEDSGLWAGVLSRGAGWPHRWASSGDRCHVMHGPDDLSEGVRGGGEAQGARAGTALLLAEPSHMGVLTRRAFCGFQDEQGKKASGHTGIVIGLYASLFRKQNRFHQDCAVLAPPSPYDSYEPHCDQHRVGKHVKVPSCPGRCGSVGWASEG